MATFFMPAPPGYGLDGQTPARPSQSKTRAHCQGWHAIAQLRALLDAGYRGTVSFEPFADAIIHADDIEQRLADSIAYLSAAVTGSTTADVNSVR